ncbi:hypothetical protein AAG906_014169 [Vitis piasezkii]
MQRDMEFGQSPQLKGVVIITLPPPDNPSLGKTITAFTLSDPPLDRPHHTRQQLQRQQHQEEEEEEEEPHQLPSPSPPNPALQFSVRKLSLGNPRILLGFLGVSLFVFLLWNFASSSPLVELRRKNDDREPTSFILPLYPKLGSRSLGDLELKLGKFVDFHVNDMKPGGINKLATSVSAFDSSTIFPVRGDVYPNGLYFTHIFVGSPPRRYFLDMDTGSDLTWIQCDAPCTSCAKGPNPLYKPKKGNLVPLKDSLCVEVQRNLKTGYCETCEQCDYEIEYADHSSSMGVLASDDLHLMLANGSLTKLGIMFGCAYDQQGLLLNSLAKTDGILGLSKAKVSLPSQLASQRIINNVLGHCLTSDATGGGYMFLGDDFVPYWGMAWVPMLNSHSPNYHSQIMKISHGSRQLSLGRQDGRTERVVFDTGSSYTYFPKEAYYALVASLKDVSDEGLIQDGSDPTLPVCWRAKFPIRSVIDVKQFFQPLTLQFRSKWWIVSTKFRIPPEGYLIISNKGNVCLGILDGSNVHDGSTIILGDISLRGKLVVYDNVNQKIGWAQSTCVKPQKIKSLPFF